MKLALLRLVTSLCPDAIVSLIYFIMKDSVFYILLLSAAKILLLYYLLTISSQSYPSKSMLFFHQLLLFLVIPMEYSASVNPKRVLLHEGNIMEHTLSLPRLSSIPSTSSSKYPSSVRKAD